MNQSLRRFIHVTMAMAAAAFAVPASAEELPWTLRNHYSFPAGNAVLAYADDSALWRVTLNDATVVADDVSFDVVLDDGTVLSPATLGKGTCVRESVTGSQGESDRYTVTFPETQGLTISHSVTRFGNRLFLVMDLTVKNTGDTPVRIAAIMPANMRAGSIVELGKLATVSGRSVTERGGGIVVRSRGGGGLTLIHSPEKQACLAVGLLPSGRATIAGGFDSMGTSWGGRFECNYSPNISLAPGESLAADRLWISHGTPNPHQVDLEYAWLYSTLERPEQKFPDPTVWVSVPDSEGLGVLADAARSWRSSGVRYALIPRFWEGRPGSLEGGAPGYPKSIASAAETLRQAGSIPGITVDPLLADDGKKEWAVRSDGGSVWVDLSNSEAMDYQVKRLSKLFGEGFDFACVARSMIPDAALLAFGQSRAEADRLAFEAARTAAGVRPVFATPEAELRLDRDAWRAAGAAASRLAHYRVAPGAVTLMIDRDMELSEETAAALRLWPGAIEIIGDASSSVRRELNTVFGQGPLSAYPVDAATASPSEWQPDVAEEQLGQVDGTRSVSEARLASRP